LLKEEQFSDTLLVTAAVLHGREEAGMDSRLELGLGLEESRVVN
jgi:hypothetical protein